MILSVSLGLWQDRPAAEIVEYLRGLGIATFKLPERLELRDELPRKPAGQGPET